MTTQNLGNGIIFNGKSYSIEMGFYPNKRLALVLENRSDPADRVIITRNLPEVTMQRDEIAVQNWGNNFGIVRCLSGHNLIHVPEIDKVLDGENLVPIYRITPRLLTYLGIFT